VGKLRIIVAEDDPDMRTALVFLLRHAFEIVDVVEDGRSLVESACSRHPEVIVSDIRMPGLTGPEAMLELSARGEKIPFVLVSADHDFIRPPTWSFVGKTVISSELVAAIHAVASGRNYDSHRNRFSQRPAPANPGTGI
jgi:DNA-binding NtrC family response regulator